MSSGARLVPPLGAEDRGEVGASCGLLGLQPPVEFARVLFLRRLCARSYASRAWASISPRRAPTVTAKPTIGMSVWLRDHADYQMGVRLAKDGPFKKSQDESRDGEPLPYTPPPVGLFPNERSST
jgi:hypothetical protein